MADADYKAQWNYFSDKAAAFASGTPLTNTADPDENVLRALGARAGIATLVSNVIVGTTESIITATKVMNDEQSSHGEKAAAALRCFSGVSMLVAFTGPTGLMAGTAISAVLSMITLLLDAFAANPDRKTEFQQLAELIKALHAQDALNCIEGAQFLLNSQIGRIHDLPLHSQTSDQILAKGQIAGGITQYELAKAFAWLNKPENQKLEQWEQVFLACADTVVQIISLMARMSTLILPVQVQVTEFLNVVKVWGNQIESWMDAVMDTVDECGDLWVAHGSGLYVRNPFQPPRSDGGWKDMNIGRVRSISMSPATGRIWAELSDYKLSTGTKDNRTYVFNPGPEHPAIEGVIDVCLVPWAGGDTKNSFDTLLVTSAGADRKQKPKLMINEWYEKRKDRHFTADEMERVPPAWGFHQPWHICEGGPDGPDLLMARAFRGLPIQSDFSTQKQTVDCVYLVQQSARFGEAAQPVCQLSYTTLARLTRPDPNKPWSWTFPKVVELKGPFSGQFFRITAAKRYLYVFTPSKAWRVKHDDILNQDKGDWRKQADCWQEVILPWDCEPWKTKGLWGHDRNCGWGATGDDPFSWWSKCLNDLYAWSDDHVVGVVGDDYGGLLMSGHFAPADRNQWEEFALLAQDVTDPGRIAQDGASVVVVAGVPQITSDKNTLYFRIFGPNKERVVDIDETKVPNRTEKKIEQLKNEIRRFGRNASTGEMDVSDEDKRRLIHLVTEIVGGAWKWREIGGRGSRIFKLKPTSFDYCRWLRQCGKSLQADTEKALAAGASGAPSTR